jgi:tetratricopeptide (TPR) repeat protein
MANMFTDTGRVEQAVPLLREAVHENPDHAESHWELGYAYRFAGMLEESVSECERARRLDPSVKLNSSTLNSYLYLGLYDRFLDSLPKSDDVALIVFYRGLGKYYLQKKREAIADFDRSFELDSSIPQTRVGKGISLAIRQLNSEGEAILRALEEKINSRGRYDPEAIYKIAQAYAVLGNKTSSLRVLKWSIENGFFPYAYLLTDPLLENVRREPQFRTLMEIARRRRNAFQAAFFKK